VGLRDGLDRCRKFYSPPGFDPRTVQPVAVLYTDYAIPAPSYGRVEFIFTRADKRVTI
jgi:hypothetical protein